MRISKWFISMFSLALIQSIKNKIGWLKGYGTCPNCGNSWRMNSIGGINYDGSRGVMICSDCLNMPGDLDVERIAANLTKSGWAKDEVEKVGEAIRSHKELSRSEKYSLRCMELSKEVFLKKESLVWFYTKNPELDNQTPKGALDDGRLREVERLFRKEF